MQNSRKDSLGSWKGIGPVSFRGTITDSQTSKAIKIFTVCEIVNGAVERGKLESKGPINIQCRLTDDGVYTFEINPRFSGTESIRALVGYNAPDALIRREVLGEQIKKGDVFTTAKLAAINAVKKTSDLIFLAHPIPITEVNVSLEVDEKQSEVRLTTDVQSVGKPELNLKQ
jgi:translation elongation factor EF-1alpha